MGFLKKMQKTPKSLRLHIGIFGRTNVGKSTFLNYLSNQDVSITSPIPGTTTDVVEKTMELLPIGPVVFLDTAGLDDVSDLGSLRLKKTEKIFNRSDVYILLVEPNMWGKYEDRVMAEAKKRKTPLIIVINKADLTKIKAGFIKKIESFSRNIMISESLSKEKQDETIFELKDLLLKVVPDDFLNPPPLIGDLVPEGEIAVLIVPIDLEAPKGRLIVPQVQTIRDLLDNDAACVVVKEKEYSHIIKSLKNPPAISVCDSQVVMKMVSDTPKDVKCTTFSILFSRYKGDLIEAARSAAVIDRLKPKDKVLIAESCSHHPIEDDIARVKIPRWLKQYLGFDITIDIFAGHDYPDNLNDYKLIIHCGGCMMGRRQMLSRINRAKEAHIAITNYGVCISLVHGVLERVLSPFPAALDAYKKEKKKKR